MNDRLSRWLLWLFGLFGVFLLVAGVVHLAAPEWALEHVTSPSRPLLSVGHARFRGGLAVGVGVALIWIAGSALRARWGQRRSRAGA